MYQSKSIEEIQTEYREASQRFKEAERELQAATAKETKEAFAIVGMKIVDARFYAESEGAYVLTFEDGSTATFSATGDDATYVTMSLNLSK